MTMPPSGGATDAEDRTPLVPADPWGRWALALVLATAGTAVLSVFFPWWAIRSEDGSRLALWGGQSCLTSPSSGTSCTPYSGTAYLSPLPALASTLGLLEVLQLVAVVAFILAAATYPLPRIRARARLVPAAAALVGTAFAWVAVVDAWFAIPAADSLPFGATGITTFAGEYGSFYGSYGYAWGADGAWFLLLLVGGLGILTLLALRAAVRETRASRSASPRVR